MKPSQQKFRLTHPEREMFTDPPLTKRELFDYYLAVSKWMLPGILRRPISLVRCPDGLAGQCFFQRNPSPGFGASVQSARVGRNTVLFVEDLHGLLSLVQMNVIEIHAWGSTIDDVQHPDQLVLDLDPGAGVPFGRIAAAAQLVREHLQSMKLESFVRTSGGKGLHVVVPLQPKADWDTAKAFAHGITRLFARQWPRDFSEVAGAENRQGRIFIDYLRNGLSASSVASYSVRARPGAGVATPLAWDELPKLASAAQFSVKNVLQRLRRRKKDPWARFTRVRQQLPK